MKNWSENVIWNPTQVAMPKNEQEIIDLIHKARSEKKRVRMIGSGHSFTPLCETDDIAISLDNMQGIISREGNLVTVHAGTKLYRLGDELAAIGLAQENLGDINKQSLAGAISTGTHGTGFELKSIATQAVSITLISGTGEKLTINETEHSDLFRAAQLSLGSIGVVTEITLRCKEKYNLELDIRKEKLQDMLDRLNEILETNRHFEFYLIPETDWVQTRYSNIVESDATYTSKLKAFINDIILENWALEQLCRYNKWFPKQSRRVSNLLAAFISNEKKVQQSHNVFSTVRNVKFVEMEYNVPFEAYKSVVNELQKMLKNNKYGISFPLEHRFIEKDDIMLSPANNRKSAYIACHVYKGMDYERYFQELEALFVDHIGRPHWGKMHTRTADYFQKVYPEFNLFKQIRAQLDPDGIFKTPYISSLLD
ncbi:MAG: hypothetical protein RL264_2344 [Bacteroidota bacterium]|jgi:FAD-linked oxidoreductase